MRRHRFTRSRRGTRQPPGHIRRACLSGSPAFRSPRLDGGLSIDDYPPLWATAGRAWWTYRFCPCSRSRRRRTTTPRVTARQSTSLPPNYIAAAATFRAPTVLRSSADPPGATCSITAAAPVINNCEYSDDGDLISGRHALGVGRVPSASSRGGSGSLRNGGGGGSNWTGVQSPALSITSGRFGGSNNRSRAMAATHQQAALAGLGMGVGGFDLGLG